MTIISHTSLGENLKLTLSVRQPLGPIEFIPSHSRAASWRWHDSWPVRRISPIHSGLIPDVAIHRGVPGRLELAIHPQETLRTEARGEAVAFRASAPA